MIKKSYFFIPLLLIFTGCTASKSVADNSEHNINTNNNTNKEIIISYEEYQKLFKSENEEKKSEVITTPIEYKKAKNLSSNANDKEIKAALMEFYNEWKNVKYKFGGNSKKGIDCSAFTQRIFKEKFNVKIPRSTRTQVKSGESIKKSQLQLGDLVFFKTGKYDRHVGVYMGDGNFMHASIKGIKFTKLNKPFYKKAYWTSRRVLD
jgi:lipoprotein Spr